MPPPAVTVAVPLAPPEQPALVLAVIIAVNACTGWTIVTAEVAIQLFESVTVTAYIPAANPVTVWLAEPPGHNMEYPGVPPLMATLAEPVDAPLHNTGVTTFAVAVNWVGSPIVNSTVPVQPTPSVTVTV